MYGYEERTLWMGSRKTTEHEDEASPLLGIRNISMAIIYGEGDEKAFGRLQQEVSSLEQDNGEED